MGMAVGRWFERESGSSAAIVNRAAGGIARDLPSLRILIKSRGAVSQSIIVRLAGSDSGAAMIGGAR